MLPACGLGLLLLAGTAQADPGEKLYGNVRVHRETGDLLGAEIAVHEQSVRPWVEYVLCEGWCNSAVRAEITPAKAGFSFVHVEPLVHQDGSTAAPLTSRVTVRYVGRKLSVSTTGDGSFGVMLLKPLKARFGLAVAAQCDGCTASTVP